MTACGRARPDPEIKIIVKKELQSVEPDERLRNCKARPSKRTVKDDVAVSLLLAELFAYGDDCKSKNDATWDSIDRNREAVEKANREAIPQ